MRGTMSRNKGKRGEREVIDLLQPVVNEVRQHFGLPELILKRNTLQSDRGGSDIAGLPWLAAEVKLHAKPQVEMWWKQTMDQAEAHQVPVLFYRIDRQRSWTVRMMGTTFYAGSEVHGVCDFNMTFFLRWFRIVMVYKCERELLG